MNTPVVAVDGTAGSGKSSVSRGVAGALGLRYLDTGAMYRAMTLWMVQHQVAIDDPAAIVEAVDRPVIQVGTEPDAAWITLDGEDVSAAIRTPAVTAAVSAVSAVPAVRVRLAQAQRQVAANAREAGVGLIAEGRDMGTVVFPDADVKIFLKADPQVRAQRRAAEDATRGHGTGVADTAADLARRDAADSHRATSPLRVAEDALVIDASYDDLPTVTAKVAEVVRQWLASQTGVGTASERL